MMKAKVGEILSTILKENAYIRQNGRVASQRTVTAYTEVLNMAFDLLADIGFKLENPRNLNETHVAALCQHWYREGKKFRQCKNICRSSAFSPAGLVRNPW